MAVPKLRRRDELYWAFKSDRYRFGAVVVRESARAAVLLYFAYKVEPDGLAKLVNVLQKWV
jgi:hypothetical protein